MLDDFHFLRPAWLLLLPFMLWVAWRLCSGSRAGGGWQRVVDARLQPYVLAGPEVLRERGWPLIAAILATVLGIFALAGPTWDRLPVPAYRSDEALVVALDLSRSMDAGDLEPTRLARARIKLLSLLERRTSGQTALVVFSAHAFTVTPLTNDTKTIAALVGSVATDIMPSRGSYIEAGLDKAADLLRQTGMTAGEILLITDAEVSPRSLDIARDFRREGYMIHVLAVGTEEGAPIAQREGGFLTDASGQVVVPRLNTAGLRRLASTGGGRFAQITANDRDLEQLFPRESVGEISTDSGAEEYEADIWRDQGIWLTLALLPIVAFGFRRGWVYVLIPVLLLPAPRADAFTWPDLWLRADQQGLEAMEAGEPEVAADLFVDPEWRGAARYRAGNFATSASVLDGVDSVTAYYNRGNALAKSGELEQAIASYDRALELEPTHADAIYNRELVSELLEQQQEQQQQEQSEDEQDQSQQGEQSQDGEQSQQSDETEQGEQSEQDSSSNAENQRQADESDVEDEGAQNDEPQQADADQESTESESQEQELQASAAPEDIEEWASEQAADQWLRRVAQDPGGLLRRKFLYQYQRLGVDQDGNYVWPGDETEPW